MYYYLVTRRYKMSPLDLEHVLYTKLILIGNSLLLLCYYWIYDWIRFLSIHSPTILNFTSKCANKPSFLLVCSIDSSSIHLSNTSPQVYSKCQWNMFGVGSTGTGSCYLRQWYRRVRIKRFLLWAMWNSYLQTQTLKTDFSALFI